MNKLIKKAQNKLGKGLGKAKKVFDPNFRRVVKLRLGGVSDEFKEEADASEGGIRKRQYGSYDAYIEHQKSKLEMIRSGGTHGLDGVDLAKYDAHFRKSLSSRLASLGLALQGKSALCLAARIGTEVKAFIDQGAFAVGVDLNPGEKNQYVVVGDFHHLVFADGSLDVVYSNSLDHAFDIAKLAAEVHRVVKIGGHCYIELQSGRAENKRVNTGYWEALEWDDHNVIVNHFVQLGFKVSSTVQFTEPWEGVGVILQKQR